MGILLALWELTGNTESNPFLPDRKAKRKWFGFLLCFFSHCNLKGSLMIIEKFHLASCFDDNFHLMADFIQNKPQKKTTCWYLKRTWMESYRIWAAMKTLEFHQWLETCHVHVCHLLTIPSTHRREEEIKAPPKTIKKKKTYWLNLVINHQSSMWFPVQLNMMTTATYMLTVAE